MADLPSITLSTCPPPTTGVEHRAQQWLSPPAAARVYGFALKTVWRRISDGTLPAYRVTGTRSVRIRIADLDALMVPIVGGAE
jgi:excisionase family DNA binding protein